MTTPEQLVIVITAGADTTYVFDPIDDGENLLLLGYYVDSSTSNKGNVLCVHLSGHEANGVSTHVAIAGSGQATSCASNGVVVVVPPAASYIDLAKPVLISTRVQEQKWSSLRAKVTTLAGAVVAASDTGGGTPLVTLRLLVTKKQHRYKATALTSMQSEAVGYLSDAYGRV